VIWTGIELGFGLMLGIWGFIKLYRLMQNSVLPWTRLNRRYLVHACLYVLLIVVPVLWIHFH
jgi:hypothetical protein